MNKEYELNLCYFKQGDDLAAHLEVCPAAPAKALMEHSGMLECDAETLRIMARYVRKGQIKVTDAAGHSIFVEVADELLGRRLVKKGILRELADEEEEEEIGPHGHA